MPVDTAFRQQRLKAWQPILTPKTVLPLFFAVGVIFAPIGGLLLYASASVQELTIDYSQCRYQAPQCSVSNTTKIPSSAITSYFKNTTSPDRAPTWCQYNTSVPYHAGAVNINTRVCQLEFDIPDKIGPPVLLYYQLTNFYQNHRRYVKSFDQKQLSGVARSGKDINGSDCDPLQSEYPSGLPYYPCGLIANSVFNDVQHSKRSQLARRDGSCELYYDEQRNCMG